MRLDPAELSTNSTCRLAPVADTPSWPGGAAVARRNANPRREAGDRTVLSKVPVDPPR